MDATIKLWKEFLGWGLYEGIRPNNAAQLLHALFNACDKHEKHWPTVSGLGCLSLPMCLLAKGLESFCDVY